jgi:AraC family transcriptional regulator, regulatory protein of adaptative response / methylated-DNA-[protein]-cysteine methyltransferase
MRGTPDPGHPDELNGPDDVARAFPGLVVAGAGPLLAAWVYTPIGGMVAVCDGDALHLLEFTNRPILRAQLTRVARGGVIGLGRTGVTDAVQNQLTDWFAGRRRSFDLPLALSGTAFTQGVWNGLATVPFGTTQTYADFAARIGHPGKARAVGRANGANPLSIIVPCHRLTGAGGALTGYGGGLWRKEWLIAHEAAVAAGHLPVGA